MFACCHRGNAYSDSSRSAASGFGIALQDFDRLAGLRRARLDQPAPARSTIAALEYSYEIVRIDRWLVYERRRVSHSYGSCDDWRDEEVERQNPLTDVSIGEILEGALSIEPARWTRVDQMRVTAYLKARNWRRYQARTGTGRESLREWRYRR
jgi:hypothetical protein